jgi:hypothetical protein
VGGGRGRGHIAGGAGQSRGSGWRRSYPGAGAAAGSWPWEAAVGEQAGDGGTSPEELAGGGVRVSGGAIRGRRGGREASQGQRGLEGGRDPASRGGSRRRHASSGSGDRIPGGGDQFDG